MVIPNRAGAKPISRFISYSCIGVFILPPSDFLEEWLVIDIIQASAIFINIKYIYR